MPNGWRDILHCPLDCQRTQVPFEEKLQAFTHRVPFCCQEAHGLNADRYFDDTRVVWAEDERFLS